MKKLFFKDFDGSTASIKQNRDGTFTLKIVTSNGIKFLNKKFDSIRGAKISMGKSGQSWRAVS